MNEHARSQWPTVILIYCLSIASAMVVSEGVPALSGIAAELRPGSPVVIGLVMSIPALVVALGGLLTGVLVDRAGDRSLLLIGGAIMLAGDIGVMFSSAMAPLLAWRVVGGFGYLFMAVAGVTMMMRVSQGRARVAALALWSTVIPASFIGAFVSGALLHGLNWRWVFGMHALVSAVLLAIGAATLPRVRADEATVSRSAGMMTVLRSPWPYALGLSFAAAAFLQTGMIAVLVNLLAMRIGAGEAEVHSFGIVAMLCNVAGAFSVGMLLNRSVPAWMIGVAGAVLAGLTALYLRFGVADLPTAIAVDCALMLSLGMLAGMWALLPRVVPSPQTFGATSGLVTQITLLGVLFGPPAAFASLGFGPVGFFALVGVTLVGTLAAVPIWLRRPPSATNGTAPVGVAH